MGKKGKRERDEIEEIGRLRKQILVASNKGAYKEVASLHNQLGYIYRSREEFDDAIEQHTLEARVTREHAPADIISLAIAYRNIGEVHIDMKNEEEAIKFIKKYLKLAISQNHLVEQQRAHITLGRISLGLADKYTENEQNDPEASHKRGVELANAQRQFDRAREILKDLKNQLNERELAEMRCGTYLNLGITLDLQDKSDEAISLMEKAVAVARTFGFCDSLHRCYSSLYATYTKLRKYKEAYDMAKQICKVAKLIGSKTQEFEARILEAKTLFLLNEMDKGINILKRLRKQLKRNESATDMLEEVDPILTAAVRISKADDDCLATEKHDLQKQKSLFEIKGDNYVTLGNFPEAIKNYLRSISFAEKLGLAGKQLGVLYFSLAATYRDCGDYENALRYFKKEMNVNEGNKIEEFRTQTNIADCLDRAKKSVDEVTAAYQKAIKFAKDFPRKQIVGLKSLSHYYKSVGNEEGAERLLHQAKQIEKGLKPSSNTDEDDSQELLLDDDDPIDLDDLSSAESETEDEEETDVAKNTIVAQKPVKFRKNEKGETPLHIAAQKGDIKAVRRLLSKGHEVNPRDFSGWIPLHEACNFGHLDVVVELLNHKANVNDSGGDMCKGITPIHDAASNGHIAVMKALLKHGASAVMRDKEGNRPVDALVGWYESVRKTGSLTEGDIEEYKEMKECLINLMKKVGRTYTAKDEQIARRKATSRRTPSPVFSVMRTGDLDDPVPVTIKVVDPDENEGRAGVNEYNEAMCMMRRNGSNKYRETSRAKMKPQSSKEGLLAESQCIEGDWMISDDNLIPDTSSSKRKRDPFDDLKSADRNIRRRHEGKRNAVAQMDIRDKTRMPIASISSGESDHEVVDNNSQNSNNNNTNNNSEELNLVGDSIFGSSNSPTRVRDPDMIIDDSSSSDGDVQILGKDSLMETLYSPPTVTSSSLSRPRQTKLPFKRVSSGSLKKSSSSNSLRERSPTPVLGSGKSSYKLNLSNSSRAQESTLRLKIEILGTKILVPVMQLDETIDWLCKEAANRYYKESVNGVQPTLTLTLKDGTILSRTDRIRDAISEFDSELIAKVEEYTVVASGARFEAACKKFNIEENADAVRALTRSETTEGLILTDICLRGKINEALFQTIQHNFLRELNLSGCLLRDEGFKRLCTMIHTLVELEKLDISCNGLTHESLGKLSEAFSKTSNPGQAPRQPIGIKTLILDHNPLGNSIVNSLFLIIPRLQNIKHVSVIDCNLTAAFFSKNKKDFISVVNASSIEILDISYNHLGKGGVQILQTELQSNRIQVVVTCCE